MAGNPAMCISDLNLSVIFISFGARTSFFLHVIDLSQSITIYHNLSQSITQKNFRDDSSQNMYYMLHMYYSLLLLK